MNFVSSTDTRIVIFVVKLTFEMSTVQQHLFSPEVSIGNWVLALSAVIHQNTLVKKPLFFIFLRGGGVGFGVGVGVCGGWVCVCVWGGGGGMGGVIELDMSNLTYF